MRRPALAPYASPARHEAVSAIIRRHSSNRRDVRLAALGGLDLGGVEEVLDLGCGFGFMAEELAPLIAPGGRITGIDACEGNAEVYRGKVERAGRRAAFIRALVDASLPCPDRAFDLVICSYSLYFFPEIIPEVARVLGPDGAFVALTHSEGSFAGLLSAIGVPAAASGLPELIRRFSAESGGAQLAPCFAEVRRVNYGNLLHFYAGDGEDLADYVRFKLPLIADGCERAGFEETDLVAEAGRTLKRLGWVKIEKDDAAFICRRPR